MLLDWDEHKRWMNHQKHGFDFAELDLAFFQQARIYPAHDHRELAVGLFKGQMIAVVFRPMGTEGLSIISMRRAGQRERRRYEETNQADDGI